MDAKVLTHLVVYQVYARPELLWDVYALVFVAQRVGPALQVPVVGMMRASVLLAVLGDVRVLKTTRRLVRISEFSAAQKAPAMELSTTRMDLVFVHRAVRLQVAHV
jgi:hypothetical protein